MRKQMRAKDTQVVVVGAGVVGLCTALQLLADGREVLLVERGGPGCGASTGNAGVIANYACVPLGTPAVLKALPRLLFDPNSPLSISMAHLPGLAPWLSRFAVASLPRAARRSAKALTPLLTTSLDAYLPLLEQAGGQQLLTTNGALHLFRTEKDFQTAAWDMAIREAENIPQRVLDGAEIAALEPQLAIRFERGVFYPKAAHFRDPAALIQRLAAAVITQGGEICCGEVHTLRSDDDTVQLTGQNVRLRAETAVIAAGAWSAQLARQVGDRIPLETERGYHVEFACDRPLLSRPVCPIELGFYLTPMAGRLRAAGTVELSHLNLPAKQRRLELLERGARSVLPDLGISGSKWLGFRPSLPDSLPVIGRSATSPNVVYAFGHGHLGLTLAAATAQLVAQIVAGATPPTAAPFSPTRF